LTVRQEVSIEIDVVLVCSPNPCHSERIQNVNENQRRVFGERRQSIEELKLDSGAGKPLDAVNTGRVEKNMLRGLRSEPANVDAQASGGRRAGGQFQDMEPATRFVHQGATLRPCFLVPLVKV